MNIVDKIVNGNSIVQEWTSIINQFVKQADADPYLWDNMLKLLDLIDREVKQHLLVEENVLFPVMKKVFPAELHSLITEIEQEHQKIWGYVNSLETYATRDLLVKTPTAKNDVVQICNYILDHLQPHAEKEDTKLYPLIKQYFKSTDLQEVKLRYDKLTTK